tara:strand:- start:13708 stop:14205 length:498 start_codon:yes stop_codon:yes gene_type:complete
MNEIQKGTLTRKEVNDAILAHQNMAVSVARGFKRSSPDMDISDLEGVALSLLCEAMNSYRSSGLTVGKYALNKIKFGLRDFAKKERLLRGRYGVELFDIHEAEAEDLDEKIDIKRFLESLDEEHRDILIESCKGKSTREIAEEISKSHATVSRRIKSAIASYSDA